MGTIVLELLSIYGLWSKDIFTPLTKMDIFEFAADTA